VTRSLGATLLIAATPAAAQQQPVSPANAALAPVPQGRLTLLEAIRLGRQRGVNAALAQINLRAANARVGERRADLLPTISGQAAYVRQTVNLDEFGIPIATGVTPPLSLWRFRLAGSETVFDASVLARLHAARDTALAVGLDARAVGEIAGASTGLAYLRVLSARETARAREADSAVAADLLSQARQLVQAGVSPLIDRTRSEVTFAAARGQLEVARNALDRANLDFLRTLDLAPGTEVDLADSLEVGAPRFPERPDEAGRYARDHRAELLAERARTEAARRSLKAIRYENLPNLGVSGYYQQSAQSLGSLAGTYGVQVGLNVPILDGFRRQNRATEQQARIDAQELRERDLGNQVETEARQAVLDLASARQQVTIARDRLQLAEQELEQAKERFRAGVTGSVETTQAQGSLVAARDAFIQSRVNYSSAWVSAYRALGILDQIQ
jgi:outer membrane protein